MRRRFRRTKVSASSASVRLAGLSLVWLPKGTNAARQ